MRSSHSNSYVFIHRLTGYDLICEAWAWFAIAASRRGFGDGWLPGSMGKKALDPAVTAVVDCRETDSSHGMFSAVAMAVGMCKARERAHRRSRRCSRKAC